MSERQPDAVLWDFIRGATMTQALAVVVELGIPEVLAEQKMTVAEIATEVGADEATLHRLLRACASDGVFAEEEHGVFRNTETSERLRGDGWPEFARLFGGVFYHALAGLDQAVEHGTATFAETFGTDFWSWLGAHPDERALFDRAMAGGKERIAGRLAELEWRDDEVVVDVGGGNGALLVALLRRLPRLRGVVFDLPETERDEANFFDRIEFVPGSFFEQVPTADTYLLSAILHDWDDERAGAILRVIRSAARDHARLLVLESVIPPGNEPNGAKWLDLLMLILSGRERTEAEWRGLIEPAGYRIERIEDGLIEAQCL
jgi:O-methyltransferase domain/Dimerisation domain